jgi:predicted tellurium resistance membrane protein TerC
MLLILGLAISIPLVIFGSTLLLHLMERWPIIITIGGGLLGFVAGEMLVTDPALKDWLAGLGVAFEGEKPKLAGISLELICGVIGAVIVIVAGTLLGKRRAMKAQVHEAAAESEPPKT